MTQLAQSPISTGTIAFADIYAQQVIGTLLLPLDQPHNNRLIAVPPLREYKLHIAIDAPCNAVVVGMPNVGKSAMLDIWAWRLLQAGVHVLLIGGDHNTHASLLRVVRTAGYETDHYPYAMAGRFDGCAALTVVDMCEDATHLPIQTLIKLIGDDRAALVEVQPPLIVMLDEVALNAACTPALTQAAATWPALGISLWVVVARAQELCRATDLAVKSVWAAADLRIWFRTHPDDVGAVLLRAVTQQQQPGEVVLWQRGQLCVSGRVGPQDVVEQRIVAARGFQTEPDPRNTFLEQLLETGKEQRTMPVHGPPRAVIRDKEHVLYQVGDGYAVVVDTPRPPADPQTMEVLDALTIIARYPSFALFVEVLEQRRGAPLPAPLDDEEQAHTAAFACRQADTVIDASATM